MALITDVGLWELIKHLKQWLTNLKRANAKRKQDSVAALRSVIVAARNTNVYMRRISEAGIQDHSEEAKLAVMWTELGFRLTDLGLLKLAKRCDIKGRYWSDPKHFDKDFIEKADIGLEVMESLAKKMVFEIENTK